MNRLLLLMLVAMPVMGQTPPLPKLPHVQRVKLDAKSAESEAKGGGVTFHHNALESCDPGWRLEAKDWWLPNPVNIKENLCYKATPDGQWWHEVPLDSPLLASETPIVAPDPLKPDAKQVTPPSDATYDYIAAGIKHAVKARDILDAVAINPQVKACAAKGWQVNDTECVRVSIGVMRVLSDWKYIPVPDPPTPKP